MKRSLLVLTPLIVRSVAVAECFLRWCEPVLTLEEVVRLTVAVQCRSLVLLHRDVVGVCRRVLMRRGQDNVGGHLVSSFGE